MKAIVTKYIPRTETKPSRVKASDSDNNSVIISYNDDSSHKEAAIALCQKMNWHGTLTGGGVKDGYVFVFSDPKNEFTV
jgi:hypothetical protein